MAAPVPLAFRIAANLEELRANLAQAKAQLETTKSSMKAMANGLDGSKLLSDANAMVKVVTDLGGAGRLTEANQKRVNATLNEAIAQYKALGAQAPEAMQEIANATARISPPLSLAQKAAGLLSGTFAQFTLAGVASNAISSLIGDVMKFADIGITKLPAVQASYSRLTAGMKIDSAEMLATMNTATKGLVSNYDLMLSANKAMLLGLPVTSESMGDLAKTAGILGKAMGQDATSSLNDLITALGRSSPMILDNLGLSVKVGEANEAYAAKLGKTADALTEAEKKMAFYEAAMEAARKKTAEIGEQTRTLTEMVSAAWARIGDVISEQAAHINNAFGPAEQTYAKQFFGALHLDTEQASQDFQDLGRWVDTVTGKMDKLPKVAAIKPQVGASVEMPKVTIAELLAMGDALDKTREAQNKAGEAARKHAEAIDALFKKYSGANATAAMKDLDAVFKRLASTGQLTKQQIDAIVKEAIKLQGEGGKMTAGLWEMVRVTDALNPGLNQNAIDIAKLGKQITLTIPQLSAYEQALKSISVISLPKFKVGLFGGEDIGIPEIPKGVRQSMWSGLFGTSAEMGQYLAQTITGAFQGGGDAIKSSISALGSMAMGNLGKSLVGTADKAGPLFNSALGKIFAGALPVIGSLIGPLAGAIWGKLFGTAGRDMVKDFVAGFGGFDAFHAMLGKELPQDSERLWIALTQGVGRNNPQEARKIIDEITAALAKQKEKTAEVAQAATSAAAEQQAALDAISAKYDGILDKLKGELGTFSSALQAEQDAPEFNELGERIYGVLEQQMMARKEMLDEQIKNAEIAKEAELGAAKETFDGMLEAGRKVDDALRELFRKPMEMGPPSWPGGWGGFGGTGPSGTPTYSGSGGGASGYSRSSSPSMGDQHITLVMPDGEVLLRQVVKSGKRLGIM